MNEFEQDEEEGSAAPGKKTAPLKTQDELLIEVSECVEIVLKMYSDIEPSSLLGHIGSVLCVGPSCSGESDHRPSWRHWYGASWNHLKHRGSTRYLSIYLSMNPKLILLLPWLQCLSPASQAPWLISGSFMNVDVTSRSHILFHFLVIIESKKDTPPLNEDSILFSKGRVSIGRVRALLMNFICF